MDAQVQTPGIGDNSKELTEEQKQALFFHHKRLYINGLARKKAADASFKNVCKKAKAEGVDPRLIKFAIDLEGDEDGSLDEERRQREQIANWMAIDYGGQSDFFDRTPLVDKARAEGKRAGMAGDICSPPHDAGTEAGQAWMNGWHEGQAVLASTLPLFQGADTSVLIKGVNDHDDGADDEFGDDALDGE